MWIDCRFPMETGVPKHRGYREDWKSDITVWINGMDCGTWTCPGDFGARRGRLMPPDWPVGSTQYGVLKTWEVRKDGSYLNGECISDVTIDMLKVMEKPYIKVRIGNKKDAEYVGGFNLFGKHFGDYDQDYYSVNGILVHRFRNNCIIHLSTNPIAQFKKPQRSPLRLRF